MGLRMMRLAGLSDERLADVAAEDGLANYGHYELLPKLQRSRVDVNAPIWPVNSV